MLSVHIESIKQYTEYGTGAKSLKKIDDYTFNSIFNIIINSYSSVQKLFLLTQIKSLVFLDSNSLTDETKSIKSGLSGHFWGFYNNSSSEKNCLENFLFHTLHEQPTKFCIEISKDYYSIFLDCLFQSLINLTTIYRSRTEQIMEEVIKVLDTDHKSSTIFKINKIIKKDTDFKDVYRYVAESRRLYSKVFSLYEKLKYNF